MKKIVYLSMVLVATGLLALSCSKDDGPKTPEESTAPEISSFSPTSGNPGITVEINGKNFSATTTGNVVSFNGQAATVDIASATKLTVTVPDGATTGKIKVVVGDEEVTSSNDFTVTTATTEAIELSSDVVALSTLDTAQLTITNLDDFENPQVEWESGDSNLLEVDAEGNMTALNPGATFIKATIGDLVAQATVTISPSVFITGSMEDKAVVWKNGEVMYSMAGSDPIYNAIGKAIAINGKDVHVAGYDDDGDFPRGRAWTNGTITITLTGVSPLNGVVNADGEIYYVGWQNDGKRRARAWHNDNVIELSDGMNDAYGNASFGYNGKVYVTGEEYNGTIANCKLWDIEGGDKDFAPGQYPYGARGNAIFVNSTSKYIVGDDYTENQNKIAKIWDEDGELYTLTNEDDNDGSALAVHGNNEILVVGGYEEVSAIDQANLWVINNGLTNIKLSDGNMDARVNGIYMHEGTIYAVGYKDTAIDREAYMWKISSTGTVLEEGMISASGEANAIIIH